MKHFGLFIILTFLCITARADSIILDYPELYQVQTNWCWAGVTANMLKYYGVTVNQCHLADLARQNGWDAANSCGSLGTEDCCNNPSSCNKCNDMNTISRLLGKYGVSANLAENSIASTQKIITELRNARPIIYRWAWKNGKDEQTGSAHFLTIHGINTDYMYENDYMVYYFDPGYNEGLHVASYEYMKGQERHHVWTHTTTLKSTPNNTCDGQKACCNCHNRNQCCDGCRIISAQKNQACFVGDNTCKTSGTCQEGLCLGEQAAADGTACTPKNPCATQGQCQDGFCIGIRQKSCPPTGPCVEEGYCNSNTGTCIYNNKPDGYACTTQNKCALNSTCINGVCTATDIKSCVNQGQCLKTGVCTPSTGECTKPLETNGKTCNDNNSCTINDSCQDGVCQGTPIATCPPRECYAPGTCQNSVGECTYEPLPDGSSCDDGDPCTAEECQNGVCTVTNHNCDDNNNCTDDFCTANGCQHITKPNGQSCGQGKCGPGYCMNGTCTYSNDAFNSTCNDGDPCTNNRCDNDRGCYYTPMADGEICGPAKICQAGKCVNDPQTTLKRGCQNGSPNCWLLALAVLLLFKQRRSVQ